VGECNLGKLLGQTTIRDLWPPAQTTSAGIQGRELCARRVRGDSSAAAAHFGRAPETRPADAGKNQARAIEEKRTRGGRQQRDQQTPVKHQAKAVSFFSFFFLKEKKKKRMNRDSNLHTKDCLRVHGFLTAQANHYAHSSIYGNLVIHVTIS